LVPAAASAAAEVKHPVPALQAPVDGFGHMLGSATSHTLNSHHPLWPPDNMWLWIGSGTTPTTCPSAVFKPSGVRSRNIGWLGQVRAEVLSGHCAKLLAPRLGSKTLLEDVQGMPVRSHRGWRKAGTMTSRVLIAWSGIGATVASTPTVHGLEELDVAGPEELQK
jgi:hypothetical protein